MEQQKGDCDFCKAKEVEIWDVFDIFLFFPCESWQKNICEKCLEEYEEEAA